MGPRYLLIEIFKYALVPVLIGIIAFCRRKWPAFIGLFQGDKVQQELSEDLEDLEKSLKKCRSECKELRDKDERREIAFEELFDQVQGYRLVRDRQREVIDKANVRLVKLQQDLDTEGKHDGINK